MDSVDQVNKSLDKDNKVCYLFKAEVLHTSSFDRRKLIRHICSIIVDFKLEKEILKILRNY